MEFQCPARPGNGPLGLTVMPGFQSQLLLLPAAPHLAEWTSWQIPTCPDLAVLAPLLGRAPAGGLRVTPALPCGGVPASRPLAGPGQTPPASSRCVPPRRPQGGCVLGRSTSRLFHPKDGDLIKCHANPFAKIKPL